MITKFELRTYTTGFDRPPQRRGPFADVAEAIAYAASGLAAKSAREWAADAAHWEPGQDGHLRLTGHLWQPQGIHPSPFVIVPVSVPAPDADRIAHALETARRWGHGQGDPAWVIDQMVRALTDDGYPQWVCAVQADGGTWNPGNAS